jgi:hypothetical protein
VARETFDVIIVGARCAGATTALALARRGLRALVLDRARVPSDTLSTHNFSRETTARFRDLGLLDAIRATGAPPIRGMRLVAPEAGVAFAGRYQAVDGIDAGYCVRRLLLDEIIVRAAREAGAEVREASPVTGLLWEGERVVGVKVRATDRRGAGRVRAGARYGADAGLRSLAGGGAADRNACACRATGFLAGAGTSAGGRGPGNQRTRAHGRRSGSDSGARAGAGRAGHGRYTSRGLAASDCCSALAAAARVGGGTEDQPHGAVPGEVVPAPVEQHENTIAKADQFDDMQPQPRQPGEEA